MKKLKILISVLFLSVLQFNVLAKGEKVYMKMKNNLTNEVKTFEHGEGKKLYTLNDLSCWLDREEDTYEVLVSCSSPNPDGKRVAAQLVPRMYTKCSPEISNHTVHFLVPGYKDKEWVIPIYTVTATACKSVLE